MPDVEPDELRKAIQRNFGCDSRFLEVVPVHETWQGQVAWSGSVSVFELIGHPSAKRAYAWSHAIDGSNKRRFVTVLHDGPITSPLAAVRAAAVDHYRKGNR